MSWVQVKDFCQKAGAATEASLHGTASAIQDAYAISAKSITDASGICKDSMIGTGHAVEEMYTGSVQAISSAVASSIDGRNNISQSDHKQSDQKTKTTLIRLRRSCIRPKAPCKSASRSTVAAPNCASACQGSALLRVRSTPSQATSITRLALLLPVPILLLLLSGRSLEVCLVELVAHCWADVSCRSWVRRVRSAWLVM